MLFYELIEILAHKNRLQWEVIGCLIDRHVGAPTGRDPVIVDIDLDITDYMLGSRGTIWVDNQIVSRLFPGFLAFCDPLSLLKQLLKSGEITAVDGVTILVH